ncbi:SCO family protein [Candidatus Frankia alpina]|uniref:SCO family protein n=1 Tax=Candidatus Frankia alpina TaxID=2699483 RepID=UPI001F42F791|nr:SCO family protein [Candidatus Frankia alpina]
MALDDVPADGDARRGGGVLGGPGMRVWPACRGLVALVVALGVAVLGVGVLAACGGADPAGGGPPAVVGGPPRGSGAANTAGGGWHGTVPGVAVPRPSFVLTDTGGHRYDFARATAGRATLLFFGYTHCPDVCPTTMADLAAARQVAGPAIAAKVTVVFVTTDPARDTPAVLRRWLAQFDAGFVGLTGTPAQIDAAQRAVGVPIALADPAVRAGDGPAYLVSHASQVLGIGPDDRVRVRYFADTKVAEYVADLPRLVAAL